MIVSYNFEGGILMLKKLAATVLIGVGVLLAPADGTEARASGWWH